MLRWVVVGLTVLAATGLNVRAQVLNLLENGGFESGYFEVPGWVVGPAYAHVGPAWSKYAEHFGATTQRTEGEVSLYFNGGQGLPNAYIMQVVQVVPGTRYRLSFDYGVYYDGYNTALDPASPQSLEVKVHEGSGTTVFNFEYKSQPIDALATSPAIPTVRADNPTSDLLYVAPATFQTFTYEFVPTHPAVLVSFRDSVLNATLNEDGILDNVALVGVSPIPEPAWAPCAASMLLIGFGLTRRRLRQGHASL